jgi:hypothetical protein
MGLSVGGIYLRAREGLTQDHVVEAVRGYWVDLGAAPSAEKARAVARASERAPIARRAPLCVPRVPPSARLAVTIGLLGTTIDPLALPRAPQIPASRPRRLPSAPLGPPIDPL